MASPVRGDSVSVSCLLEKEPMSEPTLLYLVKQLELAVRAQLDATTSSAGLTPLQYTALTVLERHPGVTAADLARNSFVRAQTMAQMVTDLEERGFLARDRDPESKRQYLLTLTPAGRDALETLREPVRSIETQMLSDLDETDARRFRAALRTCRASLAGAAAH